MADISKEIQDFQDAEYGEEVRGSMISLAEKLNYEVEQNTTDVAAAVEDAENAAGTANSAASGAGQAAQAAQAAANTANTAAANANAARDDILQRLEDGELKGDKGDKGDPGAQGASGVMAPSAGMFSLYLDPETGDLYAEYPDGSTPPAFEYDVESGNLYFVTDDGGDT